MPEPRVLRFHQIGRARAAAAASTLMVSAALLVGCAASRSERVALDPGDEAVLRAEGVSASIATFNAGPGPVNIEWMHDGRAAADPFDLPAGASVGEQRTGALLFRVRNLGDEPVSTDVRVSGTRWWSIERNGEMIAGGP